MGLLVVLQKSCHSKFLDIILITILVASSFPIGFAFLPHESLPPSLPLPKRQRRSLVGPVITIVSGSAAAVNQNKNNDGSEEEEEEEDHFQPYYDALLSSLPDTADKRCNSKSIPAPYKASSSSSETISTTRRTLTEAIIVSFVGGTTTTLATPAAAAARAKAPDAPPISSSSSTLSAILEDDDKVLSSLIYKKVLGQGSYKTVYLVQQQDDDLDSSKSKKWAMAVEKVRSKAEAKSRLKGIRRAEQIQAILAATKRKGGKDEDDDNSSSGMNSFERVERWWFQSAALSEFQVDGPVFPSSSSIEQQTTRTQKIPTKFLGRSKWLVALKPLYDMDLKKFVQKSPTRYPIITTSGTTIGSTASTKSSSTSTSSLSNKKNKLNNGETSTTTNLSRDNKKQNHNIVAGMDLNDRDSSALRLAYEICQAGRIMHDACSLIHRDIKPANIMLRDGGRPVIIDFGFSDFVVVDDEPTQQQPQGGAKLGGGGGPRQQQQQRRCIEQPGKIKGEVGYMLADDAALFRGCTQGDTYAMGKTLYEVIFGSADSSASSSSSSSTSSDSISSSSSSSSSSGSSASSKLSVDKIRAKETKFRSVLSSDQAGTKSRFRLSENGRDTLMYIIQGLCRKDDPMSFGEAAEYLEKKKSMPKKQDATY